MLLLLLGYKVRNLSKFTCFGPNLWSFLVHFSPFFCARHPTQLRKAHRRELATWCTTYCCKVWFLSNQTISTVDHGICLFSGGNFQHWFFHKPEVTLSMITSGSQRAPNDHFSSSFRRGHTYRPDDHHKQGKFVFSFQVTWWWINNLLACIRPTQ